MPHSPLGWLDFLVPKDGQSRLIKTAIPFGPHRKHRLDLYGPSRGGGPWPVLLFVHGGGWDSGDRTEYGFAGRALAALNRAGAGFARMSGSGATCFGLFETGNVAKRAALELRARHPDWFVAATRSIASETEAHGND